MNTVVARTCTEIGPDGATIGNAGPLSEFRDYAAYVLLGDPGAGKTTEFKSERRALGDSAEFISARDFISLDLDSHPEWRDNTLFIDGLDEMRSGAVDSRVPLDEIRNRLDRLGGPKFRLSCREADWLGNNDRRSLEVVSRNSEITVLRLDPLSDRATTELLSSWMAPVDVETFLIRAQDLPFGLLRNPLTLDLLIDATRRGQVWPTSRRQTFEMACEVMAIDPNGEHQAGTEELPCETILEAAGFLCAIQLLTGVDGVSLTRHSQMCSFFSLSAVGGTECQLSQDFLKRALHTRLFSGIDDQGFSPIHRQVAEFLGARYLAKRIDKSLPAQRVVALMTGPSDGRVVSALRGLSAWLAAHAPQARRQLIDADPLSVGLYGDIQQFSSEDKLRLLKSLAELAAQEHLLGREYGTVEAFRSLASADMAPAIKELLSSAKALEERITEFVLKVVSKADESELETLTGLVPDLETILFDKSSSVPVRTAALDAYIHVAPLEDGRTEKLTQLLTQAHQRMLPDPDDELRGTLLEFLYPASVHPSDVWKYITLPNQPNFVGRFRRFWRDKLLENSSDQHTTQLLDSLIEFAPSLKSVSYEPETKDLLIELLARGLESHGEMIGRSRLYEWLNTTGESLRNSPLLDKDSLLRVQTWLEAHPEIQKEIFLTWLEGRDQDELVWLAGYWRCNALHGSTLPADFGLWCLKKAVEVGDTEPVISDDLLWRAHHALNDPTINEGLTIEIMRERTRGHERLAQQLDELCTPPPQYEKARTDASERKERKRITEFAAKERQRRADWDAQLRANQTELRENRFSPPNLHTLANVYFDDDRGDDRNASPRHRIRDFVGGDPHLADLVLVALREAVWRDDVPRAEETISLRTESEQPWLAIPVLASLSLHGDDPAELDDLADSQKRNALAVYYSAYARVHVNSGHQSASHCHDRWFDQDPELVLDTMYQCAVSGIRSGEEHPPGLEDLDLIVGHDEAVNSLRLRLLKAYPTRAPARQLPLLDRLLANTYAHPDRKKLKMLVDKKLSLESVTVAQQVRWLTIGALVSPDERRNEWTEFVGHSEKRVEHLAEFLRNSSNRHRSAGVIPISYHRFAYSILASFTEPMMLRDAIKLLGRWCPPTELRGYETRVTSASEQVRGSIDALSSQTDIKAVRALTELVNDPSLGQWRDQLIWARQRQDAALRDRSYVHPNVEQVLNTLRDLLPANAGDLTALLNDRLGDISLDLRGGNSNIWRQFWNEDKHGRLTEPKHENSCRDALLETLRHRLPSRVDLQPEGQYAAGKQADFRFSFGDFKVPIEIKKNSHPELWSALHEQLIAKYTTDPDSSGHGIYLVLWFGADKTTSPPDGNRPATSGELKKRLEAVLDADESRKVVVIVLDVTKPCDT